ncbi:alanine racemase [Shigella flexneri]
MQTATVLINRRALRHNLQRLVNWPRHQLVAVVKANTYGHGLIETARTLPDADAFGVAVLEEALRLGRGASRDLFCYWKGFEARTILPTISAEHLVDPR